MCYVVDVRVILLGALCCCVFVRIACVASVWWWFVVVRRVRDAECYFVFNVRAVTGMYEEWIVGGVRCV